MFLNLYRIATLLAFPLIVLYLKKRQAGGKEDPVRIGERFGRPGIPRPDGKLVWLHAASVGEFISVVPLIERMAQQFPSVSVLVTTGTVSSAKLAETRLPAGVLHQYVPVDSVLPVRRFLRHWRPSLALWVESEFWPNLLTQTAGTCPVLLLNARISDGSYRRWKRYPFFIKPLLACFSLCLPQSAQDASRLQALGAADVKAIGNLKYDAPPLPADTETLDALRQSLENRLVWVAASTHPGEEAMIAQAHLANKGNFPHLLTVIIPRHAYRGTEIAAQLQGVNVALRSLNQAVGPETDIYIADTMGELGLFYRLAEYAFIGGSLVEHGGQNPLEAARLGVAILAGPHTHNFREIMQEMDGAFLRVEDADALAERLGELCADATKRRALGQAALSVAQGKAGIVDGYIAAIAAYV